MEETAPILVQPISHQDLNGWSPIVGEETTQFLSTIVPESSRISVQNAAVSIVSKCVPPNRDEGHETGLIVGYVQSGKTMSFETVSVLARDNGYQIVIVIAGISNALLEQSTGRLHGDLGINDSTQSRRWVPFQNPTSSDIKNIRSVLSEWRNASTPPNLKKSILITVLKNHSRLQDLKVLMERLNLASVPTLIIDDEADQASLNYMVEENQESTIYRCLMELRQIIPNHTYLQYTATPQAPLLINLIDSLSPNFVQVIEPGDSYVGGRHFFGEDSNYVVVIPPIDIPNNEEYRAEPPDSLMDALSVFIVGVAAGLKTQGDLGNRSMLVHPSHLVDLHQQYYTWVDSIITGWRKIFRISGEDPDKDELMEELRVAHQNLKTTVGHALPAFEELELYFESALLNTRILQVNAADGATPQIPWNENYAWILVGGQAMNRGFTVEGLTVTYMPRGIGVGNADTIQQRARFFGYKKDYFGFCRVYLANESQYAFKSYVEHEEYIRNQLVEIQNKNQPLDEWKRTFILDSELRPCRNQVLGLDYMHESFADSWVTQSIVLAPEELIDTNRQTVDEFIRFLEPNFEENYGHQKRTRGQIHHVCDDVPLEHALDKLLINYRYTDTVDSQRNTLLLLQLGNVINENPDEVCTVFVMSPKRGRRRSVNELGKISQLFQGAHPVSPPDQRGTIYPGDRFIRKDDQISIQIHKLELTDSDSDVVGRNVPVLSVWVPRRLARDWLTQESQ